MRMRDFIKKYRRRIDFIIQMRSNNPKTKLNDKDREQWILNDEDLYNWAKRNGVKI